MIIKHAELLATAVKVEQYPQTTLPEIALAGRSNVGKSSFINKMIQRRNLARTSSNPGKTQTLNFYGLDEKLLLVDVPGYGYAKVSHSLRDSWGKMIERYLLQREQLVAVLLIIDIRHEPSKNDQAMYEWLIQNGLQVKVIVTKADKIPRGKWQKHMSIVRKTLGVLNPFDLYLFSSETGQGKDEIWDMISDLLQTR
jgi:GTP-binding protein